MSSSPPSHRAAAPLHELLLETAEVVRSVLAGRSMTDVLAEVPPEFRAGTQALSFHAMRRLGEARAVRRILVPRDPPEPLLDALLMTAIALLLPAGDEAQAAEMPTYSEHTVVDQAVKAAGAMQRLQPFKGLVNGALRAFLRDTAGTLAQTAKQIEARWNHPQWWVDKLRSAYPQQWEAVLDAANRPPPMTLRVNRRRATRDGVLAAFANAGIAAAPCADTDAGITLQTPRPVQRLPGFEEGWWSVQDAGAQLAAPLLQIADGMRVLDACAAPGGKTAHLLELADVNLLALDSDARRLQRVGQNLDRLGLRTPRTELKAGDAANPAAWWDGVPFDAVLADVPCTAAGIVRRHPDIRWLRRADDVARTVKLQSRIVDALWKTVAVGGRLLYVTCSVFPDEGERQAAAFASRHPGARRLQAPGQLLPVADATPERQRDGFFYALFAKDS